MSPAVVGVTYANNNKNKLPFSLCSLCSLCFLSFPPFLSGFLAQLWEFFVQIMPKRILTNSPFCFLNLLSVPVGSPTLSSH